MQPFHLFTHKMLQGNFKIGKVNIVFVFQVNCPGCFSYGIPLMNNLFKKFGNEVSFIGLSTAFEDFELNTNDNTLQLLKTGKLVGETMKYFSSIGIDAYNHKILFPVAFDVLAPANEFLTEENIYRICRRNRNFETLSSEKQQTLLKSVIHYYSSLPYIAETFTLNQLKGTPTFIIFDKNYNILQSFFGHQEGDLIELALRYYRTEKK